jgi:hypothetical protein
MAGLHIHWYLKKQKAKTISATTGQVIRLYKATIRKAWYVLVKEVERIKNYQFHNFCPYILLCKCRHNLDPSLSQSNLPVQYGYQHMYRYSSTDVSHIRGFLVKWENHTQTRAISGINKIIQQLCSKYRILLHRLGSAQNFCCFFD